MNKLSQILLLALMAINMGCSMETVESDMVDSDAIYQDYAVSYSSDSNNTRVWAQYRVGGGFGSSIHLVEPSKLRINGKTIHSTWFPFLGTYYSGVIAEGYQENVVIDWYDPEMVLFRNQISMSPIAVNNPSTNLDTSVIYSVSVTTGALASTDSVTATIEQDQPNSDGGTSLVTINGSYSQSSKMVTFDRASLGRLISGIATLHVVRSRSGYLQAATKEGGSIRSEYEARTVRLQVTNNKAQ